ncbi:MAG: hypothetical protein WB696_23860 [Chthoniobacterales bacterium]
MSGKRGRHLSKGEERMNETVGHGADLTFHALTPDRWPDFETLVGPRGACAGCWCMWWRLTSREFRDGAGVTNRDRFQECVREPTPPIGSLYGHRGAFTRAGFHVVATPTPVRRIMRKQLSL